MAEFVQGFDESILFFIQENLKNPVLDRIMVFATKLGNSGFLWIFIAFLLLSQKRYQRCGIPLICALSLTMFLSDDILKPLVGRIRPSDKFLNILPIIGRPHTASFPSGHTAVAFASAAVIFHYYRAAGILAYLTAALIAYSRLYLFVHYPTDILGGILLGSAVSYMIVKAIEKLYTLIPTHQS